MKRTAASTIGVSEMTNLNPTCHQDGTITYWSFYDQEWKRRRWTIADDELTAMGPKNRTRVMLHLGINRLGRG